MAVSDQMMSAKASSDFAMTTTSAQTPNCIVCDAPETQVFWRDERRTIRRCRACSLLFVFPQPKPDNLHEEFQSNYFSSGRAPGATRLELEFESWRRPMLTRITNRIRAVKPAGRLLDVGCASGEIFAYFRDGNWESYGVEPSAMAFARAQQRFGDDPRVHLFNGYLSDLKPQEPFDVITVLESLFYMPNPRQEVSYIAGILKDDGLLVIATPGYAYQRLRTLTPSHLFYFSRKSLTALLETAGFQIIETVPLGSSVYGGRAGRFARNLYVTFSRALSAATLGRLNLAPHVLYLCQKSNLVRA